MSFPYWKCLDCGEEFNPVNKDQDFDFNCPICGSIQTKPRRSSEEEQKLRKPAEWNNDNTK
jgi:DNA-directed RNA polymerase subunit RPC12/RpoP